MDLSDVIGKDKMDKIHLTKAEEAEWLSWIHNIFQQEAEAALQETLGKMFPTQSEAVSTLLENIEKKVA